MTDAEIERLRASFRALALLDRTPDPDAWMADVLDQVMEAEGADGDAVSTVDDLDRLFRFSADR